MSATCSASIAAVYSISALAKFDKTKSIKRYVPPKGTAGLALSMVNGISRFPSPPASTIARTLGRARMS